MDDILILKTIR